MCEGLDEEVKYVTKANAATICQWSNRVGGGRGKGNTIHHIY